VTKEGLTYYDSKLKNILSGKEELGAAEEALSSSKEYTDAELQEFAAEVNASLTVFGQEIDSKANATHNHDTKYDAKGSADTALETANAYTDEQVGALNEGFSDVIYQMYGSDLTGDGAPTIRQIAGDEANKVQGSLDEHKNASNPHNISKSTIGLGNVNNTSDMAKPVSTAQQAAIDAAAAVGTNAQAALDAHIADKANPHAVTKAQVGLSNVPNVTTNNQTPTYTVPTTLTGLTSGETLSTAMGKTAKAVTDFIAHNANKSNPHGVTYTQVGADKAGSAAEVQSNLDTVDDKVDDHIANDDIHFTAAERTKLSGIATGANKYTHPNSGVTAGTYKSVTVNAQGHVTGGTNPTTLAGYGITDAEAKGSVNTHNTSTSAHNDIRTLISDLTTKVNNFLDVDDTTTDQLSELIALINANKTSIETITSGKVNVSDIVNNLTTNSSSKVLSAAQGVALKALIDALDSNKVDKVSGKGLSTNDYTTAEKTKLSGIATGAEVNQNAFSNIVVGSTTVVADSKTDSLTLEGSNVTITADATNDKVTFSVADGSTSAKGLVKLTNSTSSTSTTTAATPSSVKSAYDLANTAKTNAATAQTKADSAYDLANTANTTANTNKTNLSTHTSKTDNPHSVTKSQVGLGNVPNVATNDQTPTYTAASSLTALTSGEKLSVAMGKTAKAVSSLISHLAASNPHGITKSTVGLGNVDNTADANKTVKAAGTATTATTLSGLTATIAELNILDGVTATAAEINKLDGLTATTAQLNKTATLSAVATSGSYTDLSNKPAIPTVYTAVQCTTYTSDSGTVTPLAVQNAAKKFAIPRITSVDNAIAKFNGTTGDVQNSGVIIEDVVNTKDNSHAEVIAIPASGGKKMVYGYCTDQVDGTSFLGGLFDADATEFPYSSGLAIGGSSGNLLWKGTKVATTADLPGNATTSKAGLMSAADKTKLDGLQSGGSFDFDALIDASGFSYTYTKSSNTHTETIKQGSTTYATRTSTKNTSTGAWTVAIVCSAAGVNVTKTYTPSSTGWTVA